MHLERKKKNFLSLLPNTQSKRCMQEYRPVSTTRNDLKKYHVFSGYITLRRFLLLSMNCRVFLGKIIKLHIIAFSMIGNSEFSFFYLTCNCRDKRRFHSICFHEKVNITNRIWTRHADSTFCADFLTPSAHPCRRTYNVFIRGRCTLDGIICIRKIWYAYDDVEAAVLVR